MNRDGRAKRILIELILVLNSASIGMVVSYLLHAESRVKSLAFLIAVIAAIQICIIIGRPFSSTRSNP